MGESEPLKPCPFCGGEPEVSSYVAKFTEDAGKTFTSVKCSRVGCPGNAIGGEYVDSPGMVPVAEWTRRAPSPVVAEVVKEMRAEKFNEPGTPMWIRAQVIDWASRLERGE